MAERPPHCECGARHLCVMHFADRRTYDPFGNTADSGSAARAITTGTSMTRARKSPGKLRAVNPIDRA